MSAPTEVGAIAADAPGASDKANSEGGLFVRLRGFCSACRQVIGLPDYERYLAHAARRHPGEPALSRAEFCAREIDRKYGGGRARCC